MAKEIEREREGAKCIAISADVRDIKSLEKAVEETIKELGRIDFVIAGAAGNFLSTIDVLSILHSHLYPSEIPFSNSDFLTCSVSTFDILNLSSDIFSLISLGPLLKRLQNSPRNRHPRQLQYPQSHNPSPQTLQRQYPFRLRHAPLPRHNSPSPCLGR